MIKNERGFSYPLTLAVIVVLTLLITYYAEIFLSEKRIFLTTETILREEYYFAHAFKSIEGQLQIDKNISGEIFYFKEGTVVVNINPTSINLLQVNLQGQLTNGVSWSGYGIYDKNEEKMVKWVERK